MKIPMKPNLFYAQMNLIMGIIIFSFMFPSVSSAEDAKDRILWGVRHFPPLYILEGEYKDQGIADQMLKIIFRNLPEYEHIKVVANNKRSEYQIKMGKHFAKLAMLKRADREKYMYYSIPHYISPSHRLILRKVALPKIQDIISTNNEVSLESLLKIPDIKIGVELGRSVGKELDKIINRHKGQRNITVIASPNTEKTIRMLTDGGIECIIEYPAVVTFILKKDTQKMDQLTSLNIKEKEPWVVLYAVAPKNEWGQTLIKKLNVIFKREMPKKEYRSLIEQWLDESSIDAFRVEYQRTLVEGFTQ